MHSEDPEYRDNMNDILFYLESFEKEARAELRRLKFNDDWMSEDASNFIVLLRAGELPKTERKIKEQMRAEDMYKTLGYISDVREAISTGKYLRAVKSALFTTLCLLQGNARNGEASIDSGRKGGLARSNIYSDIPDIIFEWNAELKESYPCVTKRAAEIAVLLKTKFGTIHKCDTIYRAIKDK